MTDDLPRHVTGADVRAAADEATTLLDVQRLLRVERWKARQILDNRGLRDAVKQAGPESAGDLRDQLEDVP